MMDTYNYREKRRRERLQNTFEMLWEEGRAKSDNLTNNKKFNFHKNFTKKSEHKIFNYT